MKAWMLAIAIPVLAACAATRDRPAGSAALPPDFTVDLTIVAAAPPPPDAPAQLRPGRYVVFPDGTLHHGVDPPPDAPPAGWLPPTLRALDRDQVAGLWALLRELGLGPEAADPVINPNLIAPPDAGTLYVLALTGDGRRWSFVRPAGADGGMGRFARVLAALAWVEDGAEPPAMIIPRRYDFGPDPDAPYRR